MGQHYFFGWLPFPNCPSLVLAVVFENWFGGQGDAADRSHVERDAACQS